MSVVQIIIHFCLGFVISFVGSIPFGSINITVARISITGNSSSAHHFIIGATLAELFYSFIAIHFSAFLMTFPNLEFWIQLITIPIFVLLSCSYFLAKPKPDTMISPSVNKSNFYEGLVIGFLNPLQIPFWLAYGTYFLSVGWIKEDFILLTIFVLGVIAGSSFLLLLIAKFASRYSSKIGIDETLLNKMVGGIFIVLAFYQGIRML